jgi:hypothetical protein
VHTKCPQCGYGASWIPDGTERWRVSYRVDHESKCTMADVKPDTGGDSPVKQRDCPVLKAAVEAAALKHQKREKPEEGERPSPL